MASFLEDIYQLTGRMTSFQETHKKEILETLCDSSVSLKDWELAALSFLDGEGVEVSSSNLICRAGVISYLHVKILGTECNLEGNLDHVCFAFSVNMLHLTVPQGL